MNAHKPPAAAEQTPPQKVTTKSPLRTIASGLRKLAIALLVLIGLAMVMMYAVQRDYYRRVNVNESLAYGKQVAAAVIRYHAAARQLPKRLSEVGPLPDQPREIGSIELDPSNGILRIQVADAPKDEQALELVPTVAHGGELTYACRSVNIPDKFRPAACPRQS